MGYAKLQEETVNHLTMFLSPTALQPGVGLVLLQEFLPSFPV